MAEIVRFPIPLAPARRRRLARQDSLMPKAFDERVRRQNRRIEEAGGSALDAQDLKFIAACKRGQIKPKDISGSERRAVMARRIVRDLNEQGARERNESFSG
jgi:hypothetical protein